MATLASRDQALSLLMAANSHTDLAVKLSSLKQAKDILSSLDPSSATELLPYVADLHRSPESLVRLSLLEFVEDIGVKALEGSSVFVPVLLALLRDNDVMVARKSIVKGTNLFVHVLEELMFQFQQYGKVERWLEELWMWMVKFKDAVFSVAVEPGPVGMRLVALKFLEVYVLLFTSDTADTENFVGEATRGNRKNFNVSWLIGGHPVLDSSMLISEGRKVLSVLLDMLQSASTLPGSLTITVVNCLAAIARKRPLHYGTILSALLDFCPNLEPARGPHAASIQYSLRTSYLGFLRSTNPVILESRDRLLRALRTLNAGDAADQVIRQVEKIRNSERGPREARPVRDDQLPSQPSALGELSRKRSMPWDTDETTNGLEVGPKRSFYGPSSNSASPMEGSGHDFASNGSPNVPRSDGDLTPVDQMIAVIGAMLAEGERGAESIEILISKIHPDLLADIVIANMKHLPKSPPPLTRLGNLPLAQQSVSLNGPAQVAAPVTTNALQSLASAAQLPLPSFATINSSFSDLPTASNLTVDAKRDPRRDPRRLDPRRTSISGGLSSMPPMEESGALQIEFDSSISHKPLPEETVENTPSFTVSDVKSDSEIIEAPSLYDIVQPYTEVENPDATEETLPVLEVNASSSHVVSSFGLADDSAGVEMEDTDMKYDDMSSSPEADKLSPANQNASTSDETCLELPVLPLYVELSEEQRGALRNLAVQHIIESCVHIHWSDCLQTQMALLARLVSETDTDDSIIFMLGRHIVTDYRPKKGHELVLYILYHLYSLMASSSAGNLPYSALYDKFLLAVAKSLLETFPASDKSFSKLLGEVPFLPPSALKLLDDLCSSDVFDATGKDVRDSERVTQGLGAVWSLIMGRPSDRQACLEIALNCAVHVQDDIRGKAIRLVANKLYQLSYISEKIQQFATKMLLCAVDQSPGTESIHSGSTGENAGPEVGSQETSISGSEVSETGNSGLSPTSMEVSGQGASTMSLPEAQRHISLFFALCTKKPSLLQLTFDTYGRAPKVVKQALHRHIPIVIRALGSSYSELLSIISDPPQGSENLLTHVLQVLSQETTPSPDLISTVKSLYETKLQDATILIPMLSSFSKNEVLPIFPRLVELPLEKFQLALAHILQGSAHTGPALTPAEVLVAIHEIVPEKDGPPLKKIMDACSACFEQRTVFTQQVLAKALNQMVDQTPLPLLFMRTVIQAIDAFPTLVDFVMEVLSKLVSKQVWRMPKLWVGFLKCVAQTQPHSFPVLLQLPPQQLESALNKYASLRGPLSHYANLPNIKSSVPRTTLAVLGLAKDSTMQPHMSTLNPSETSSSVQGTTLT